LPENRENLIKNCADYLSLTVGEVLSIAATAPRRYYVWQVEKRSSVDRRTLCHPARELKPLQHYFQRHVLHKLAIHPAATAYVKGGSIKCNATAHVQSRVILKLDFEDFFNSIKVSNWRKYAADFFPGWTADEVEFSCRILFWGRNSYTPRCLAIGAPTSPLLSNALMFEVDVELQDFANRFGLVYTRYADDITLSTRGELDRDKAIVAVQRALSRAKYTSVRLKAEKTILVSSKFARRVTGLVITPEKRLSLGRDRKRTISAMVHHAYCRKLNAEELPRLSGLLAFAMDVEPTFISMLRRKYSVELIEWIIRYGTRNRPLG
jgi:RNA-directed DNA polymerase